MLSKFVTFLHLAAIALAALPVKDFRPNVFVLTDISNEPDDSESFVRLLLYSNEVNIKGVVATTSCWLKNVTRPDELLAIVDNYAEVHDNLLQHDPSYPAPDYVRSLISSGHPVYGLKVFDLPDISEGARNLIRAVEETPVGESTYILAWGGANVLAEALREIQNRPDYDVDAFVKKALVYSISDQDDAGYWIRSSFPKLRYIASSHAFYQYGLASWVGMSGEVLSDFDTGGPDSSLVNLDWAEKNVMSVGPLGKAYPKMAFIMEGDTPSLLYVLPNGLSVPDHPEAGGWGGRYKLVDYSGNYQHYADTVDQVVGKNNKTFSSPQATIWRWRQAYQNDFAARMQWTVKSFNESAHQPIVILNETCSYRPFELTAEVGTGLYFDASKSFDLNNATVEFKWLHYREPSLSTSTLSEVPEIKIEKLNDQGSIVKIQVPDFEKAFFNGKHEPIPSGRTYFLILEVVSQTTPKVSTYRRIMIHPDKGDNNF